MSVCRDAQATENAAPGDLGLRRSRSAVGLFYRDVFVNSTDVSFAARPPGHLLIARVVDGRFERDTEGTSECFSRGDVFAVSQPDRPYACRSTGVHLDLIGISLAAVADVTGDPTMAVPGRFQLARYRPVSAAAARTWTSTADFVTSQLADDEAAPGSAVASSAARLLAAGVLAIFPTNAVGGSPLEKSRGTHPRTVQRAITFIDAHAAQNITIVDIAAAACVTTRAIQLAFRRHLDITPREYLHRVRLERAHADLLAADAASTTVTAIACRWGFSSPSRFAADYRHAYGISPSRTLHCG